MQYPILYQKKATGKIHSWKIAVVSTGNKPPLIRTEYGQVNGKITITDKIITKAKGKNTLLEQAKQEALSKWTLMKNKKGDTAIMKNTTKRVIRPMLAKTYKPTESKIEFPVYIQPKLDGVRCLAQSNKMVTRSGKTFYPFEHIQRDLRAMYKKHKLSDNVYVDGELYTPELSFQRINGLTNIKDKATTERDKADIMKIRYYVFDMFDLSDLQKPFKERRVIISRIAKSFPNIVVVDTEIVKNKRELQAKHDEYVKEGYEGTILRIIDGTYELNKRSSNLWKYKDFEDAEFKIVGYKEGTGRAEGTVIWRVVTKDGIEFDALQSGPYEIRRQYFNDAEKYIGKKVTIRYQGYYNRNGKKVPRIAVAKGIRKNI